MNMKIEVGQPAPDFTLLNSEKEKIPEEVLEEIDSRIRLKWLIEAYRLFPNKDSFFLKSNSFNRLAGNDVLMQQIKEGKSEEEIRKSWEPELSEFKKIRKKYLLYGDFE